MTIEEAIENLEARKEHYELGWCCEELVEALDMGIKALKNQKTGHWKDCGEREPWYRCSECRKKVWGSYYKYCPDCGAKMEGEDK